MYFSCILNPVHVHDSSLVSVRLLHTSLRNSHVEDIEEYFYPDDCRQVNKKDMQTQTLSCNVGILMANYYCL